VTRVPGLSPNGALELHHPGNRGILDSTIADQLGHVRSLGPCERLGSVTPEDKKRLTDLHIAEETRQFKPPYIPSRYLQDLANSDPAELVYKYVLAKSPTAGFERLWREQRLDLTVENVAWKHRRLFPPEVGNAAEQRLRTAGFEVRSQRHVA
jgi:hypothetical protein